MMLRVLLSTVLLGSSVASAQSVDEISPGRHYTCARRGGRVACFGGDYEHPRWIEGLSDAVEIASGTSAACARRADGSVSCWQSDGPLIAIPEIRDAVQIAAGGIMCARRRGGQVSCWERLHGSDRIPVEVPGLSDAADIAVGHGHSCAARRSGRVTCWPHSDHFGDAERGQLGNGSTENPGRPVEVLDLSDAVEVAAGTSFSCARRRSGAVSCWGSGQHGLLGDGHDAVYSARPVAVQGLSDAVQIAAATDAVCARRGGGQIVCWGNNAQGMLATREAAFSARPRPVAGIAGAIDVAAPAWGHHVCARTPAAVLCWGGNAVGEIGAASLGEWVYQPVPAAVP